MHRQAPVKQFSKTLANVLNRPCIIFIPACGLKLVMGEVATIIVDGQRASSQKLQQAEFSFSYPELESALKNLLTK